MENILLIINIILAILLVVFVLFQKSEGGALGIGVSQDNFMFSRSSGNFLTKATAIIATMFIIRCRPLEKPIGLSSSTDQNQLEKPSLFIELYALLVYRIAYKMIPANRIYLIKSLFISLDFDEPSNLHQSRIIIKKKAPQINEGLLRYYEMFFI